MRVRFGQKRGSKTRNSADRITSANAAVILRPICRALPLCPRDTRAIIPRIMAPMLPALNRWLASDKGAGYGGIEDINRRRCNGSVRSGGSRADLELVPDTIARTRRHGDLSRESADKIAPLADVEHWGLVCGSGVDVDASARNKPRSDHGIGRIADHEVAGDSVKPKASRQELAFNILFRGRRRRVIQRTRNRGDNRCLRSTR